MPEQVKARLAALAEPKYQAFTAALLPGVENILGVRLPQLRKLADELVRGDWRAYLEAIATTTFEEKMLRGMVIGRAAAELPEKMALIADFVPQIDNWSVCDSFCSSLKIASERRREMWDFLQPYFVDQQAYSLRFGTVMLLHYYVSESYIDRVLPLLDSIRHEDYYVKMAVAWAISNCYIKFPQRTLQYLRDSQLDDFTYNKALQKIIESLRVDAAAKMMIRAMKRKRPRTGERNGRMHSLFFYETALGVIGIVEDGAAITKIGFGKWMPAEGEMECETPLLAAAAGQLQEYLQGARRSFDLPLAARGTEFQKRVWQALTAIPYGETRSYKEIAAQAGNPKASRAVGMANHRNPIAIVVPCHRVIGAQGALVGYAGGMAVKQRLLELEAGRQDAADRQ